MLALLPAALGCLTAAGSIALLHSKWRGNLRHPWAVPLAWVGIAATILLWCASYKADVAVPLAVITLIVLAIGLLLKSADIRTLGSYPAPGRGSAAVTSPTWSGVAARTLAIVAAAPLVGIAVAMATVTMMPGHPATRFVLAVLFFILAFAGVQLWGASAQRPWRALGLIVVVGVVAGAPMLMVR